MIARPPVSKRLQTRFAVVTRFRPHPQRGRVNRGGREARVAGAPCADSRDRPSFRFFRRGYARAGAHGVSAPPRAGGVSGTTELLRLDDVACIRGDRLLFEGLSLALNRGDALWLRGPNGRSEAHTAELQSLMSL